MRTIANILWVIFGGLIMAVEYVFFGWVLCLTIVGIPFGWQVVKLASLAIWPFGRDAVHKDCSEGCLNTGMNIVWILLGGIEIALSHAVLGLVCFITLIGIPFGKQHFKLAAVALTPFGRDIVKNAPHKRNDSTIVNVNIVNNSSNNNVNNSSDVKIDDGNGRGLSKAEVRHEEIKKQQDDKFTLFD